MERLRGSRRTISRADAIGALAAMAAVAAWPGDALAAASPRLTLAPLFAAPGPWLDGRLVAGEVAGKVVVVDVFTVDCFNCRNVTPTLRAVHRDKPGVIVVGIHTPETAWERDRGHVRAKLAELGVTWPVVLDDTNSLWDAYGIEAWPTQLFFDRTGVLQHRVVGDSQDAEVLATIDRLTA